MKCEIRRWCAEDALSLAKALNNKKVQDNLRDGIPFPYTEKDASEFIEAMLNSDENHTFAFAIAVDGKAVGSIAAFRGGNVHSRTAEVGYYLAEPFWGQGIGSQAVGLLCEYVFQNTDIVRLYADPFAYNKASFRILQKNGFQYEGTLKKNAVKNGIFQDMKMFALVKD